MTLFQTFLRNFHWSFSCLFIFSWTHLHGNQIKLDIKTCPSIIYVPDTTFSSRQRPSSLNRNSHLCHQTEDFSPFSFVLIKNDLRALILSHSEWTSHWDSVCVTTQTVNEDTKSFLFPLLWSELAASSNHPVAQITCGYLATNMCKD